LAGWQLIPAVHVTQTPTLQTWFVPHVIPSGALPDSVQTGAPVVQLITPVRQGFPVIAQAIPALQSTHVPVALQTLFAPQAVPAAAAVPLSVQVAMPVAQVSVP